MSHTCAISSLVLEGTRSSAHDCAAVELNGPSTQAPSRAPAPPSSSPASLRLRSSAATSSCTRSHESPASSVAKTPMSTSTPIPTSRIVSLALSIESPSRSCFEKHPTYESIRYGLRPPRKVPAANGRAVRLDAP